MEENGLFCDKPLGWKPGKEEEGWRNSTAIDSAHAPHAHLTSDCNGALRWGPGVALSVADRSPSLDLCVRMGVAPGGSWVGEGGELC